MQSEFLHLKNVHILKKTKRFIVLFLFTFTFFGIQNADAQQEAMYSHYMFNQIAQNPAYAGSVKAIDATAIVHQQWVGFVDSQGNHVAPETQTISVSAPISFLHGGAGLVIHQDKLGYQKEISMKLMYSYRKNMGIGNIAGGAYVGLINGYFDAAALISEGGELIDANDPALVNILGEKGDMLFDFGLGVHYQVPGRYYAGISLTRIPQSSSPQDMLAYKMKMHTFISGGYEYTLPTYPSYTIKPSVLIKSDFGRAQISFTGLVEYNKKMWGGVSYSTIKVFDPINVLLGMQIKDIRIGYSYGLPTSKIGSSGTHEIFIGYRFNLDFERPEGSYHNTRYF